MQTLPLGRVTPGKVTLVVMCKTHNPSGRLSHPTALFRSLCSLSPSLTYQQTPRATYAYYAFFNAAPLARVTVTLNVLTGDADLYIATAAANATQVTYTGTQTRHHSSPSDSSSVTLLRP